MKHFKHGGSTAARQLECPGWTSLAEGTVRVGVESEYAKVGTALSWKGISTATRTP